ncbi:MULTISPECIES: alpha/beta fold hydrolase [unclassified Rhodococcus (in: high G+C Gram-positive bacteria)]|uniref:alpha/beta fold hydrolase n=1 Tax=unclassified Rhodococcus (in: high G+C Gram-positive bacteria) TaxID=192944 RepID=UPI00146E510C|nr:alpha/beta hydrolase [Rhodococcus sp. BL-253-APC-6A1W]NMD93828.1 alpha/beta hydrolase [Rhodococcus sp. BL-253-APC-6A1W]
MTQPDTRTLDVPGASLVYDVRPASGEQRFPTLILAASPMDAGAFGTLASYFPDRTVVTYDPRGTGRGVRTDTTVDSTPRLHADDLVALIDALGTGPVDLFATSGGAVNALELVSGNPELVRTLVAHEPPIAGILPDRDGLVAACADIHDTYLRSGMGPAMAKFITLVGWKGELSDAYFEAPAPDPSAFGLPTEDDGTRDDPLVGQNILSCTGYEPDFDVLSAASTRIVPAAGRESAEEMAGRGGAALAARLGTEVTWFPGNHGGFLGDEYGMPGEPEGFAAVLREVLQPARV